MQTVLFYLPSDLVGGAEVQTELLINNLDKQLYKPVVATTPVHYTNSAFVKNLRKLCPVFDIHAPSDLRYVINNFKPHIVQHFHNNRVHEALVQTGHKCKVIEVVHGRFHFPNDVTKTPKDLTTWVVGVSKDATDFFLKNIPEFGSRTSTIANGVDVDKFSKIAEKRNYERKPVTILHLGRLCEGDKQITKIVDACCKLRVSPTMWNLRIVGEGADRALIQEHIDRYKNKFNIKMLPYTSSPETALADADILVSRSEAEGFGLSIAEGAASGLPVITWDCGGVTRYLNNEKDSCVVATDIDFSRYIDILVRSPTSRKQIGQEAAQTAREKFSGKVMANQYMELYDQLSGVSAAPVSKPKTNKRIVGISNPNFVGVTNATIGVVGRENHIQQLPIIDTYMAHGAAEKILAHNPEIVIIGGGGGYTSLASHLKIKKPKIKIMLVWHGTLSFNSFAPGDSKILADYLALLKNGTIDRIGFVKKRVHQVFNDSKCVHFPNRIPQKTSVVKLDLGPGCHIGMFGTDYPWKNQMGAMSYIGSYPKKQITIHTNKFADKSLANAMGIKIVEHGYLPSGEFKTLLGSMDCNVMLSFTESLGLTAIESFRAGVPCIVSPAIELTQTIEKSYTVIDLDHPSSIWGTLGSALEPSEFYMAKVNKELDGLDTSNEFFINEVLDKL